MKTKYGLRALGILAREYGKGPLLTSHISAQQGIPEHFLRFILLQLKRDGLLRSKRGRGGGYYLTRQPATISVGELVRLLDGSVALLPCTSPGVQQPCLECQDEKTCAIRLVFKQASDATADVLDRTSLASFASSSAVTTHSLTS